MDSDLEFAWAEPKDEGEVREFLEGTFGPDSIQADSRRLRWLYFDNPLGLHLAVCRSQGSMVAFCGHLPHLVSISGTGFVAGFGIDFMVAEHWRRKGIGREFLEMRLQRFQLSLSIGQSPSMYSLYMSQGAKDLGSFHLGTHGRTLTKGRNLRSLLRNMATVWKGRRGIRLSDGYSLEPCGIEQISVPEHRSGEPLGRWMKWRFDGSTYSDYTCSELKHHDTSLGYLICRDDHGTTIIADLVPNSPSRAALLAGAGWLNPAPETRVLFYGHDLKQDCQKAGYLIRPHGARLLACSSDRDLLAALMPGSIELMAGASDADLMRRPTAATVSG